LREEWLKEKKHALAERGNAQRENGTISHQKQRAAERERIEKGKREKERERKYSCLVNEEEIVNVKYERILFILLSFLLKWRD
jgi:hypothetical protein